MLCAPAYCPSWLNVIISVWGAEETRESGLKEKNRNKLSSTWKESSENVPLIPKVEPPLSLFLQSGATWGHQPRQLVSSVTSGPNILLEQSLRILLKPEMQMYIK